MRKNHTKADETPAWWLRQLYRSHERWRKVEDLPGHHRRELRAILDLDVPQIVVSNDDDPESGADQIDLLYLPRYARWVRSITFDAFPEVKLPRYSRISTLNGDTVSEALERAGQEADEMREWSDAITDAGTDGSFAVWYGISVEDDVVTQEGLFDATLATADVIQAGVVTGVAEAAPGQDHRMIADTAQAMASDPVTALQPGGEQIQAGLEAVVEAQEAAEERRDRRPRSPRFSRVGLWVQRRPVGYATLWEEDIDDLRDARWVARKIVMDVDLARSHPAFKPSVASTLEAGEWRYDFATTNFVSSERLTETEGEPSTKIAIWEIWDRKYRKRHYVTEGVDAFLERDASNPYVDRNGQQIIPGFFPCEIHAPVKSNRLSPNTPYGIPTMAVGWALQELIIKLASHNLDAVKKLTVRILAMDEDVSEDVEAKLTSGQTGTIVKTPAGKDVRTLVAPVNFGTVPGEVFQQLKEAQLELASVLAWPLSQMVGAPVADTATAEQISVSAGYNQLGDFVREMENSFGRAQSIKAALLKEFYPDERIAELIGQENLAAWNEWKATPSAGETFQVRFSSRVEGEDLARVKQAQDYWMMLRGDVDPSTGIPKYDTDYLVDMIGRMQGLGPAPRHEATEFEQKMAAMRAMSEAGVVGGNGREGAPRTREGPATSQQLNAAVQRVGPSRSPGGRGMFPG